MLKTGMIIAERYEIVGKIGTGGMADVYKAKDHKLNRFVAVKVLKPEFREDTTFIRKFRSEAQAAAGLTHPNIVNVFDVGDDEGVNYIVMELIEGITLKEYIAKKGRLSIKEATSIAIQVSMGLEAAHSHGIVHRDIKPQNIIISTDGKVKVTDFGIARAASSNTISSNVMGSVHYSSPEQVRGGYSDEKSDIYSLGITLYEMVTGRVPFDGDTTVAIAIKHLQEEMVLPSVYAEDLPHSLEQIILKCTQKSVSRRYENMEEVIADLKHSLIDPQGDFVKLVPASHDGKTVVISDEELGKIKNTPKNVRSSVEAENTEEDDYDGDYDEQEEELARRKAAKKRQDRQKRRTIGRIIKIVALLAGAAILVALIIYIGRNTGLFGNTSVEDPAQTPVVTQAPEDNLVEVPDLVGRTEDEARQLASERNLGTQPSGYEASTQEAGRIASQDIPAGTKVEAYTTLKYTISKGMEPVAVPDLDGMTAVAARRELEGMGLLVNVQKYYSDLDEDGYPLLEPGYVNYTVPDAGESVQTGDMVTMYVSRGADFGDSVEVPNVVGMGEDEAVTVLGKFLTINVTQQQSTEVPAGEVISQSPEAYTYADPDGSVTIIVSTGNVDPAASQTAGIQNAVDTAADGVWKCTQTLNTPEGYGGGAIRLELIQQVNGAEVSTMVLNGQPVAFPYDLDITGAAGVSTGSLYLSEEVNGEYVLMGVYTLTFEKVQ